MGLVPVDRAHDPAVGERVAAALRDLAGHRRVDRRRGSRVQGLLTAFTARRSESLTEDPAPEPDALLPIRLLVRRTDRVRVSVEVITELLESRLIKPVTEVHRWATRIPDHRHAGLCLKPPVRSGNQRAESGR